MADMAAEQADLWRAGLEDSTERLMAALHRLTNDEVRRPSLLPGWTNAHVLTHLARSAEAIMRGLDGARTGTPFDLYPGGDEGRRREIEAGASRDADALVADVKAAAEKLSTAIAAMDADIWSATVNIRGRTMPAAELIGTRWREVEIHRVDLGLGYAPQNWPAPFVSYLLTFLTGPRLSTRPPADTTLVIEATDTDTRWQVGDGTTRRTVRGPSAALAGWLAGRAEPVRTLLDGDLPELSPWA